MNESISSSLAFDGRSDEMELQGDGNLYCLTEDAGVSYGATAQAASDKGVSVELLCGDGNDVVVAGPLLSSVLCSIRLLLSSTSFFLHPYNASTLSMLYSRIGEDATRPRTYSNI